MNRSALDVLIDLATQSSDEAAQALGRTLQAEQQAEGKLKLLDEYRAEYAERCNQAMTQGLSVQAHRNYQSFLAKLDHAIEVQRQQVEQAKSLVESRRGDWQDCERKRVAFDALGKRADRVEQAREAKREQKQMDEYAMRAGLARARG